jgi:hypothetical protein
MVSHQWISSASIRNFKMDSSSALSFHSFIFREPGCLFHSEVFGHGWQLENYYKLMESIETFAKQKNVDLETSNSRQKSFTNTANNFSLSGFGSRQGFKELAKQNRTPSISLDEGYAFITDMAKAYLRKVYFDKIRVNKTS